MGVSVRPGAPQAEMLYTAALNALKAEDHEGRVVLLNNRCACYLKLKAFAKAETDASNSLKLNPNSKKAFYRRAQVWALVCPVPGAHRTAPDVPPASAGSDMIRWSRVLLSHSPHAARSY